MSNRWKINLTPGKSYAADPDVRARAAKCPIPEVPEGAKIVFLGLGTGVAIANITFGRPRDVTFVVDVQIEPGDEPIYLITSSYDMGLLRFSGMVDRIVQIVNVSVLPMGFINVDANRIVWFETRECQIRGWSPHLKIWGLDQFWKPKLQFEYVTALAGGRLDSTIVEHRAGLITIPSGRILERENVPGQISPDFDGPSAQAWKEVVKIFPDGVVSVKLEEVVAPTELRESGVIKF